MLITIGILGIVVENIALHQRVAGSNPSQDKIVLFFNKNCKLKWRENKLGFRVCLCIQAYNIKDNHSCINLFLFSFEMSTYKRCSFFVHSCEVECDC